MAELLQGNVHFAYGVFMALYTTRGLYGTLHNTWFVWHSTKHMTKGAVLILSCITGKSRSAMVELLQRSIGQSAGSYFIYL